ncbi:MAG: 30S ribosomal protein S8 [Victivallaceae bacterium]|nr:30S ribosomal protein S8 [Victivallaceae bacterium]
MSMQDPIADMLTRIRNAGLAGLATTAIPLSKTKEAIAQVLKEEGYIASASVEGEGVKRSIVVTLKYVDGKPVIAGLERVSKPSCRVYCSSTEIPRVRNGLGTVILTTHKGIMSGRKAARENVGGEILCYVW